jgi:hypothetical protein
MRRTSKWHNTGGNGPAVATWVRRRKARTVVVNVARNGNCALAQWEGLTCLKSGEFFVTLTAARKAGDTFLGVPPRKSRAKGKRFSVIGFYPDNYQPFVSWETETTPQLAVERARIKRPNTNLCIVEVVNGHVRGVLENKEVL